jgi:hypothetical protein
MINVFIGYEPDEAVAYSVLAYSIQARASQPVSIAPLMLDDIANLWKLRDDRHSVMVVKHNHVSRETVKSLGRTQSKYDKKNWSSAMLFNNVRCRALSPEYVNRASGLELHQFKWLGNDGLIGVLPERWNHLVGYNPPRPDAALVHYTIGGPYFDAFRECEYSRESFAERDAMLRVAKQQQNLAADKRR